MPHERHRALQEMLFVYFLHSDLDFRTPDRKSMCRKARYSRFFGGSLLARAWAMDPFADHFCRNYDGSWTCMSAGTFDGPDGRIQVTPGSRFFRGTVFMGFDLAAWLDEELASRAADCAPRDERRRGERRRAERRQGA